MFIFNMRNVSGHGLLAVCGALLALRGAAEPLAVSSIMSVAVGGQGHPFEAVPEDVARAFAALKREALVGGPDGGLHARHARRQNLWAALCCDAFAQHLVRCLDREDERLRSEKATANSSQHAELHDAMHLEEACATEVLLHEECLENAAWAFSHLTSADTGRTHARIALALAGQAKREWLQGSGVRAHAIDREFLCRLRASDQSAGRCFFTTRWCPFHPEHSGTLSEAEMGRGGAARWWEQNSTTDNTWRADDDHGTTKQTCLAQAREWWEWCGKMEESPMSMVFIQDVSCCCGRQASCQSCSLASAEWSTYAEIGAGASERTRSQAWSRAAHQGGRVSEEGRWRRLTAWVSPATEAEGEGARLAAAPQTYPAESEVVRALRAYNQSLVRAGEGAFTLEAAEKVIGQVYARQLSQWWASKGAASQPASFHGELLQDWWVGALLDGMRGGFFVDLAAFDAVAFSNTYALEQRLGWDGLCIEPMATHWEGLLRRRCSLVAAVVGGYTGTPVDFAKRTLGKDQGHAGVVSHDTDNRPGGGQPESNDAAQGGAGGRHTRLETVSVAAVLRDFAAPETIHYLSLDIEGFESHVLEALPFDQYRVLIITVERPDLCSRSILRVQGYVFLRDLGGQDEIWIHTSLPKFADKVRQYSRPEPRRVDDFVKSEGHEAKCRVRGCRGAAALLRQGRVGGGVGEARAVQGGAGRVRRPKLLRRGGGREVGHLMVLASLALEFWPA